MVKIRVFRKICSKKKVKNLWNLISRIILLLEMLIKTQYQ